MHTRHAPGLPPAAHTLSSLSKFCCRPSAAPETSRAAAWRVTHVSRSFTPCTQQRALHQGKEWPVAIAPRAHALPAPPLQGLPTCLASWDFTAALPAHLWDLRLHLADKLHRVADVKEGAGERQVKPGAPRRRGQAHQAVAVQHRRAALPGCGERGRGTACASLGFYAPVCI